MKTIVTGGHGCIGSSIKRGIKIGRKDVDLLNLEKTISFFKEKKPDIIIHAAAKQGNYSNMNSEKVEHFTENMRMTMNVFEAAKESGVKKLIALSTTTAFPHELSGKASEKDLFSGETHPTCYSHGYAKRMFEVLCRSYREQYGLEFTCLFLSNVYGPGFSEENGVIPFLIEKCKHAKDSKTLLDFMGKGEQTRDFIYVDDVIKVVDKIIEYDNFPYSSLIVSSGEEIKIRDILFLVCKNLNFDVENINWISSENLGQMRKVFSNSRLTSTFPDISFTNILEGIGLTIEGRKQD